MVPLGQDGEQPARSLKSDKDAEAATDGGGLNSELVGEQPWRIPELNGGV